MCLAGNFGACDGEAVVVILDLMRKGMQLGIEQWHTQNDYAKLQTKNNELRAKNARLTRQLEVKNEIVENLQQNRKDVLENHKKQIAALRAKNKTLEAEAREAHNKMVSLMEENEEFRRQLFLAEVKKTLNGTQAGVIDWNTAFAVHASHHSTCAE